MLSGLVRNRNLCFSTGGYTALPLCKTVFCVQLSVCTVFLHCVLPPHFPAAFSARALYLLGTCYQVYEVNVSIKEITAWCLAGLLSLRNAPEQHSCRSRSLINPRVKVREERKEETRKPASVSPSGSPQWHPLTPHVQIAQLIFWRANLRIPMRAGKKREKTTS